MAKASRHRLTMIYRYSKGSKRYFFFAFVATVIFTILNALTPQIIKFTVDSILGDETPDLPAFLEHTVDEWLNRTPLTTALWVAAAAVVVCALFSGIFNYICRNCVAKGSEGFIKRLRNRLFDHIQRLPFSWHAEHHTGDIIQRCTSDTEVIRGFISNQLQEVFRTVFLIVLSLCIMFSMNVKLSCISLVFVPVVIIYSGVFYAKIAKNFLYADEAEGELSSVVQENLTGVRVVRAFGRERFEIKRFDEKNEAFAQSWIKLGFITGSYWGIGDFFSGLQIILVIVFGVVEAVSGEITLGEFIAFVSYNSTLVWPMRGLGRVLADMSKSGVSMDRINYILDAEEEQDPPDACEPDLHQDVVFSDVRFAFGDGQPVLKGISFIVPAGTTLGILGGTGCGKSTLVHLLNRLYDLPQECGTITIGGVDIQTIRRDYLRKNIGMVLQEPFLFSRTIQENIGIAVDETNMEEIHHASRIACIDQSIEEFSKGYDTIVGERGVTLSGGQKQRVAIARMLMQHAPIMVFDDSLSAVDSETDAKIREALRTQTGNATVFLISHRINTLMTADQIIVLQDGKIVQQGTHESLIHQNGIYRDIYEIQMNDEDRLLTEEGEQNGSH